MNAFALEAEGISKFFPGVKALDNVSLRVRPGTVHALMGENGAGKSTLMKCLIGIYRPELAAEFERRMLGDLPADWDARYAAAIDSVDHDIGAAPQLIV